MRVFWAIFSEDLTQITIESQEIEALRKAAEHGHRVRQVRNGKDLLEQLRGPAEPIQRRTRPASTAAPEVPSA